MKQIPVNELVPGMITASDVYSMDAKMIVPKGVILTENIIARLDTYSIYYVNINDEVFDEMSKPISSFQLIQDHLPVRQNKQSSMTNRERIRNSPQFQRFCQDFNHCAEQYRTNLMKSLYSDEAFQANEIITDVMQLMYQDDSSISVFDMLLNMSNVDDSVYVHCIDVALICNILSRWLHFSDKDQITAMACGLFHDLGKFRLPASILRKPGKLTSQEFDIIKTHTIEGFHMLNKYNNIPQVVKNAALMHHEKCDGSGYPYGLKGNEIDRFAKIVTIADIFDAMTSDRVYRKAMCPFSVIKAFEDEGIQKYEMKYVLTFLENVANSYLNHKVTLSNGMEGNVIFINKDNLSKPIVMTDDNQIIDLQQQYFRNILELSANNAISIETII